VCVVALVSMTWALNSEKKGHRATSSTGSFPVSRASGLAFDISPESIEKGRVLIRESTGPLFLQGGTLNHVFTVRNDRSYPVSIRKCRDSCICLDPKYPKHVLAPGEEMPLTVKLRGTYGRQETKYFAVLETDDPESPEWSYVLDADFYPTAVADPVRVLVREMTAQSEITIKVFTYAKPQSPVRAIQSIDLGKKLKLDHTIRPYDVTLLADGVTRASYQLKLSPGPHALDLGPHTERVVCNLDNAEPLEILVQWTIEGVVTSRPARLFFLSNSNEEIRRRTLTLVSTDSKAFRLARIDSDNAAVTCSWNPEAGDSAEVVADVEVNPRLISEGFRGQLTLEVEKAGLLHRLVVPYTVMKNRS